MLVFSRREEGNVRRAGKKARVHVMHGRKKGGDARVGDVIFGADSAALEIPLLHGLLIS